jgi:hypothetical protein
MTTGELLAAGWTGDQIRVSTRRGLLMTVRLLGRPAPAVHLTRPPGADRHGPAGIRLHSGALPDEHVTVYMGLPVTTAARTVVDLARTVPFRVEPIGLD